MKSTPLPRTHYQVENMRKTPSSTVKVVWVTKDLGMRTGSRIVEMHNIYINKTTERGIRNNSEQRRYEQGGS